MSQAQDLEATLLARTLPDLLPAAEGWVWPAYDGLSIANLPATVAALLKTDWAGTLPSLPTALWADWTPGLRRVLLVILDGLGYRQLQARQAHGDGQTFADLGQAGRLLPLTSVFPSTTDAALLSLSTGRAPAEHAWLAYNLYLRELGIAANAILLTPIWSRQSDLLPEWGLDLQNLVPVPSLADTLSIAGVQTVALMHSEFKRAGFTKVLYRGVAKVHHHHEASDFWFQMRQMLAETRGHRAFLTAYWGGLDTVGHVYGPDSDPWCAELRTVSHLLSQEFLKALPAADRDGTLLLITADHGQIRIPGDQVVIANQDAELSRHLLVPVVGESRAAFVYPRLGRATQLREYLLQAFPGWFAVVDSAAALAAGLMGAPVADEALARAGELLVLPRGTHALQGFQGPSMMVGRHGGLAAEEMLVPLVGARLEALA